MKKTKIYLPLRRWTYPLRRFKRNIEAIISYIPIIWKSYDFDYIYSLDMMIHQLKRTIKLLESERAYGEGSKWRADKGKLIVNLYERYRDDFYALEPFDTMEQLYGEHSMEWEIVDNKGAKKIRGWKWEKAVDEQHNKEINETMDILLDLAQEKQNRCKKLFWRAMEEYLEYIWD
jgi:hypothetical protein